MNRGLSKPNDSGRVAGVDVPQIVGSWGWLRTRTQLRRLSLRPGPPRARYLYRGSRNKWVFLYLLTEARARLIFAALVLQLYARPAAAAGETCATAHDCGACAAGQHPECVETADVNFLHCVCKDGPASCAAGGGGAGGAALGLALLALLPRRRPGSTRSR